MLVLGRLGPRPGDWLGPRLVTGLTGPRLLPEVLGRVVTGREPGWGSLEEACTDREEIIVSTDVVRTLVC